MEGGGGGGGDRGVGMVGGPEGLPTAGALKEGVAVAATGVLGAA